MEYAEVLSTLALTVSLLTAGWTGYRTLRWGRPVVTVSGSQWTWGYCDTGELKAKYIVKILNIGDQSTQVLRAGWQLDRGDGSDVQFTCGASEESSPFPLSLERYGHSTLESNVSLNGFIGPQDLYRSRTFVEYTTRKEVVTKYGPWEESQINMYPKARLSADEGPKFES